MLVQASHVFGLHFYMFIYTVNKSLLPNQYHLAMYYSVNRRNKKTGREINLKYFLKNL